MPAITSTNPTPNQVFVANSVPSGGFFANFYRPSVDGAGVVTFGDPFGTYRVLSFSPNREAAVTDRPDIDGGDNGWTMVAGKIEGSITVQLPTDGVRNLKPGDVFATSVVFRSATNTPVKQMVVLSSMSTNMDTSARAQSGTARVNKQAAAGGGALAGTYQDLDSVEEYDGTPVTPA